MIIALTILSIVCEGQNRYGLSDEEYQYLLEGLNKRNTEPEKAGKIFDSLLITRPDICVLYYLKGLTHYNGNDLDSGKSVLKKGIVCDPTNAINYNLLKTIYVELSEYDSAELILLTYVDCADGDFDNFLNEYADLGKIARAKNQYHKSVEYLTEAINRCDDGKKYKSCGDLFYLRADSYTIIDEPQKAWEDILVYEQLNPLDRATLVLKGEILQMLGRYKASTEILKAYLTNPTHLGENWVNFMIGVNYHRLNESENSCHHLIEAKRLGYEDEKLDELLGNCK